jgi:hypothetical protein
VSTGSTTTSTAGVILGSIPSLPYTTSQLSSTDGSNKYQVTGRIISVGVRIWYIGSELNKGGEIFAFSDPSHGNLDGSSAASLSARDGCYVCPVNGKKVELVLSPTSVAETSYPGDFPQLNPVNNNIYSIYPYSNADFINAASAARGDQIGCSPMMFCVQSAVNGSPFAFELVMHSEYIGTLAEGRQTSVSADSAGMDTVHNVIGRAQESLNAFSGDFRAAARQGLNAAAELGGSFARGYMRGTGRHPGRMRLANAAHGGL